MNSLPFRFNYNLSKVPVISNITIDGSVLNMYVGQSRTYLIYETKGVGAIYLLL